ncbi:MAG TPA: SCO family protein [Steroidobacteraceae bacterium]|nr:SCO family protein [Steroidobacteraceae bacterium]
MSTLRIIRVAAVASMAALVAAVILFTLLRPSAKPQAENVPIGGPFELVDQDGTNVTDRTFAGKPSVVFFGYTSCPDACPTTLSDLSTWLNAIGRDADKLNVLFISVDPGRDTPAHLREFLSSFDPRIRGLTGTEEQIATVAKEYRAYYKRIPLEDGSYAMDHAAVIYLMDRAGRFVNPISLQTDDRIAIERLRQLAAL